jgi:hypothetical protein
MRLCLKKKVLRLRLLQLWRFSLHIWLQILIVFPKSTIGDPYPGFGAILPPEPGSRNMFQAVFMVRCSYICLGILVPLSIWNCATFRTYSWHGKQQEVGGFQDPRWKHFHIRDRGSGINIDPQHVLTTGDASAGLGRPRMEAENAGLEWRKRTQA